MSFHDIRFPPRLSRGSVGGPERRTQVVTLMSGFEERNAVWANSRRRYDAGVGMQSLDDLEALVAFFEARQGRLHGFRWKDWADFKSCKSSETILHTDQVLGVGDGSKTSFQLKKAYRSGAISYERDIVKPVVGTVLVGLQGDALAEGTHYEADLSTGVVTLNAPAPEGAQLTAGFEFDVPVRFDTDEIRVSVNGFASGEIPDVPVLEIRL